MTRALPLPLLVLALLVAALLGGPAGARAGDAVAAASTSQEAAPAGCTATADMLGVSRILEIDVTGGPKFGRTPTVPDLLNDKEVVLTFDDGPARRYTLPILDALDAECTKATFFVVGRMALSDPATLKETARRGHTIGAHTWSHKRLDQIGAVKAKEEIELGFSAIALALGEPVAPFFRFPYLGESQAMRTHLAQRDIGNFGIDVDSRDFLTRNPSVMRKNVMTQLAKAGKGIILFHDIQPSTAGGVASLLSELKAKGYKIVHMVPKAPATTIAAYDAMAAREAQRRKIALSTVPLADRSVVWPVTPGSPPAVKPAKAVPAAAAGAGEALPWSSTTQEETAGPNLPPPVRPRLKPRIDDDAWAVNPLGNY